MLVEPRSARSPTSRVSGPPKGVPPTDGAVPARAVTLQMHGQPLVGRWRPRGGVAHCLVLGRRGQPTGRDGCSAAGPHSDEAGGTCGARCCPGAQRGRAADARFARSLDHTDGLWLSQRCRSWAHPGTGFGGPQPAADGWSKDPWQRRPLTPLPGIIDMAGPRGHPRRPRPPAKVVARLGNAGVGGVCGAALEHPPLATPLLHQERSSTATTSEEGRPPIAGNRASLPGRQALECPGYRGDRRPDLGMSEHFVVASGMPGVAIHVQKLGLAVPGSSVR